MVLNKVTYKINAYKIKEEFIPKEVHFYRIKSFVNEAFNFYRFVNFYGGMIINKKDKSFVLPYKVDNKVLKYKDGNNEIPIDIEYIKSLKLEYVKPEIAEKLVRGYLKSVHKIEPELSRIIKNIRKHKVVENIKVESYCEYEVKKHDGDYYLILNFRHTASITKNLWDFVNRDKALLEEYVGKKIIFKPNPKVRYTISLVDAPNPQKIEEIMSHIIKYYKWSEDMVKSTFGEIDYNQPIMYCEEILEPFAPQFCNLVFYMDELDSYILKELQSYWRLSNENKGKIINEIAKKLRFIDNTPKELEFMKFNNTPLLVKDVNKNPTKIYSTNTLFTWIYNQNAKIYLPYDVPEIIRNKNLLTYILIDEEIKDELKAIKDKVNKMFRNYNKIANKTELPKFNYANRWKYFSTDDIRGIIKEIKSEFNDEICFALIIGKEKYKDNDYYEILKKQLFDLKIISQNILWENWRKDDKGYMTNNLLIQIMGKLGIKYFILDSKTPYDYIMGLDTGLGIFGNHRVGGCTVVYDSEGKIRRIQPIETPAPGERLHLPYVIEYLENKANIDMENKNILFLRDGFIQNSERNDLKEISKELNSNIEVISIRKNNKYKVFTSDYRIGSVFGNDGIFLPHKTPFGSNPVKLSTWLRFNCGNEEGLKINESIMQLLYDLTKMNYSALYGEGRYLRIPAPIHYADKFVKALGKNWKIDEELLKHGFLYFI